MLVIIGLIIGGIITGRDMIESARIRSQISQIEQYKTAINTFKAKYDCLPGDCVKAGDLGFLPKGTYRGTRDGNGVLEGWITWDGCGLCQHTGENPMVWVDLSTAGLIAETFNTASPTGTSGDFTGSDIGKILPTAKIGNGNYVYVYSGGVQFNNNSLPWTTNGVNYIGISAVTRVRGGFSGLDNTPRMTVIQAYNLDSKVDDGFPQTGKITDSFPTNGNGGTLWSKADANYFDHGAAPGVNANGSSSTCHDNSGSSANTMKYSTQINSGNGQNCALSFEF